MPDRYELKHWSSYHPGAIGQFDLYDAARSIVASVYPDGQITIRENPPRLTLDLIRFRDEAIAVARHHWGDQWGRGE